MMKTNSTKIETIKQHQNCDNKNLINILTKAIKHIKELLNSRHTIFSSTVLQKSVKVAVNYLLNKPKSLEVTENEEFDWQLILDFCTSSRINELTNISPDSKTFFETQINDCVDDYFSHNLMQNIPAKIPTYKLGDNTLISIEAKKTNQLGITHQSTSNTSKKKVNESLNVLKKYQSQLKNYKNLSDMEKEVATLINNDYRFFIISLSSEEVEQSIPTNNGIYKTSDDKYFQIINKKLNSLLMAEKSLPNWKNDTLLQRDEINSIFKNFIADRDVERKHRLNKQIKKAQEFEMLNCIANENFFIEYQTPYYDLIQQWCGNGNALTVKQLKTLSRLYSIFNKLFNEINVIEYSSVDDIPKRAFEALLLFATDSKEIVPEDNYGIYGNNFMINALNRLILFIKTTAGNLNTPIHDIFKHEIPLLPNTTEPTKAKNNQQISIAARWKELLQYDKKRGCSLGLTGIKALTSGTYIDIYTINNINDLRIAIQKIYAKIPVDYIEFASICTTYDVPKAQWDAIIALEQTLNFESKNNLPNLKLDNGQGLVIKKLKENSKIGYILGNITSCCLHIDGAAEQCVIDGKTLKNNGFYIIEYKGKIIGGAYAWISSAGNLCLDSIEIHPRYKERYNQIYQLFVAFANEVILKFPSILRITVGRGGGTNEIFKPGKFKKVTNPEIMEEGFAYQDAEEQICIAKSIKLDNLPDNTLSFKCAANYTKLKLQNMSPSSIMFEMVKYIGVSYKSFLQLNNLLIAGSYNINVIKNYYPNLLIGFHKNFFTYQQLKNFTDVTIALLTSQNAILGYKNKYFAFDDLNILSYEKLIALTSENVITGYKNKYFTFNELKGFNDKKIAALSLFYATFGYKNEYFTFNELKFFNEEKITALVSSNAILGYENQYYTFNELKDLSDIKINLLTSNSVVNGYRKKYFTFNELKNFNEEKITALVSSDAILGYKNQYFTFNELKDLNYTKIMLLVSPYASIGYEHEYFTFNELKIISDIKIELLILTSAVSGYRNQYFTFNELKNLSDIKIKLLTSTIVINGYRKRYFTFNELKDCEVDLIIALTSPKAMIGYENKCFTIRTFMKYSMKHLYI